MGLLDILQGNYDVADPQQLAALYAAAGMDGAQSPYGFLNAPPPVQMTGADAQPLGRPPQPNPGAMARPVDPSMTDIAGGVPPGGARPSDPQQGLAAIYAAAGMPGAPQVDTSGGRPPPAPAPAPAPAFGAGAAPFSFAGPGSMNFPQPPVQRPVAPAIAAAPSVEQASPIAVGSNYMMPRIGAADDFEPDDSTPANAAPTQGRSPAAPQAAPFSLGGAPSAGIGDRLGASVQSFANTDKGGLLGKLANGVSSLVTGQRSDPTGVALGQQAAAANANGRMLLAAGAPMAAVQAAMVPGNTAALTALFTQYLGKDKFKVQQTGEDSMGRKTFQLFNESDGSIKPIPGSDGGGTRGEGLGDMSKTGAEYLATLPPQQAQIVKGMVDGTIQPPSSFALAKPAWQAMLAAAKNLDPNFDANTWATRHKMSTDMAASGNSSMGGILANGKSAFSHLADLSGSMADLGNASHDYYGGGNVAAAQNYMGNKVLAGSDTLAKIKAINDNLGHYGQESTKFYSGTGGGVEERMNALKEVNPVTTSSEEMASYLSKEKSLMQDRLVQKEAQIRDSMGDAYLQKHPVFTPDLKTTLATIDANIAKLRGQGAAAAAPAAPGGLPAGWSVKVN